MASRRVGIVGVEVEVLAGRELGDEDKRGEREALKWMAFSWRAVSRGKAPTGSIL
jgi:ribosomal protein S3